MAILWLLSFTIASRSFTATAEHRNSPASSNILKTVHDRHEVMNYLLMKPFFDLECLLKVIHGRLRSKLQEKDKFNVKCKMFILFNICNINLDNFSRFYAQRRCSYSSYLHISAKLLCRMQIFFCSFWLISTKFEIE